MERALSEISEHLRLKISPRARRVALRLDTKDRVVNLVVPKRMKLEKAYLFAEQHADWINARVAGLPAQIPFTHGAELPLFGQLRQIRICYNTGLKTTNTALLQNAYIVLTNRGEPESRIIRDLKSRAKSHITALARDKAARLGKKAGNITVRDTKSRWGSCSSRGDLSFSWRLIFAPEAALDYVVAHEVAHLKHMNHSKAFWNTCRALSDNYLEGHTWIRASGHELMRYGGSASGNPEPLEE